MKLLSLLIPFATPALGPLPTAAVCPSAITAPLDAGPRLALPGTRYAGPIEAGLASRFEYQPTASGRSMRGCTLAHRSLPFGSRWLVVAQWQGGGEAICTVVDRTGPRMLAEWGRIVDLSPDAARAVGLSQRRGVGRVELYRIGGGQ